MEIDRLEQEEFERGGGPLQNWPPYYSGGAREWQSLLATAARAAGRETAVRLVRLGLAGFASSVCEDLSAQRSAFKLLKDAGKSVTRKRELAKEAAESLLVASSSSSSAFFSPSSLAARSAARWQRGPALAAAAGATAFRSGLLFALADFIVSATVETSRALLDAAREAKRSSGSSEGGGGGTETETGTEGGEEQALAPRRESSGYLHRLCSGALSAAAPLVETAGALIGLGAKTNSGSSSSSSSSSPAAAALAGLARSLAVALAYASATPSLVRAGTAGLPGAAVSSASAALEA